VAAGGLVLGFAASRFLKASSSRRYRATQAGDREPPPRVGRHLLAEPAAEVPVAGTYDPAASTVTTPVPVGTVPTEPDLRAPRAQ
jgi:hypothetical protein